MKFYRLKPKLSAVTFDSNERKIGCRLWNASLIIVLLLTLCNILLTVRLIHTECPKSVLHNSKTQESSENGIVEENLEGIRKTNMKSLFLAKKDCTQLPASSACNSTRDKIFNIDPRLGRWDNRRLYKIFDSALIGERYAEVSQHYMTCLATQGSLEKLLSLVEVSNHWTGPISVALFAAGNNEYRLVKGYITYLRRCFQPIRERVIFHIVFPKDRIPSIANAVRPTEDGECSQPDLVLKSLLEERSGVENKWRVRNPYPQNHLRNVARKNCQTPFVFLTDVDIVPIFNLADELNTFLKNTKCKGNCAYVVPTFELDERVRFPQNKSDLIRLASKGLARPFHQKVFIYNQYATNTSRWLKDRGNKELHISHNVTNFEFLYEPFYIAPDTVPPHDERFIGYGFTRNSQVFEMHLAGYQFQVLSPVFNCHWGLQVRKGRPSWREAQNGKNRRNFDSFKREIYARYNKPLPTKPPKPAQSESNQQPPAVAQDKKTNKDTPPVAANVS